MTQIRASSHRHTMNLVAFHHRDGNETNIEVGDSKPNQINKLKREMSGMANRVNRTRNGCLDA